MPLWTPAVRRSRTMQLLYRGVGLDYNSTSDQLLARLHSFPYFSIQAVLVGRISGTLASAVGGVYTAASKGGIAVVAASQAYTAFTAAGLGGALNVSSAGRDELALTELYLSLSTPQGAARTANMSVVGWGYDS